MNILLLNWRAPNHPKSGGAEKLNMHIVEPMLEKGHSVTWYSLAQKGHPTTEVYQGIKVIRFGNYITHFLMWPFFLYSGKFGKVDFIIDCIHGIGYLSSVFAPKTKKRILICEVAQNIWDEMWLFPINKIGKLLEKVMFFFYKYSFFWTISESTKEDLIRYGVKKDDILVLPMGFDAPSSLPKFAKVPQPTALFVGRLAEMKGIKDALLAIKIVNNRVKKKWHLRIVGRGEESYEKEIKELVKKENLGKYVTFLGFLSEEKKFEEMGKAWVLLVPSSREGWGMIVPEANLVGTQVIAYDVPGLRDVCRTYSKQNILISHNHGAFADALSTIKKPQTLKEKIQPGWDDINRLIPSIIKK